MAKEGPVRTALIGCGNRGVNAIAAAARQTPKLELVAVCDVDEARATAAGQSLGVPAETDHRRLLERYDLESVLVATSAKYHVPVALDAVRAGKHVYVEKPLADSAAAGRELATAAEAAGVVGVMGYQLRCSPFAQAFKREAASVEPIQGLVTRQRGPFRQQFFFPGHYGGIMDHVTHDVHFALWLMGGRPTSVYANVLKGQILHDETIEFASMLVELDGGQRTLSIVASMHGIQTPNVVQVVGRRGTVTSTDRKTLRVVRHAGITAPLPGQPADLQATTVETGGEGKDATGELLERFADLIRGRATYEAAATLWEGADAVAVTEAAVEAAQSGRRVEIPQVEQRR